jgi:hypothetical protein
VARCNITYADSSWCLILNSAGFCPFVNFSFLSQQIIEVAERQVSGALDSRSEARVEAIEASPARRG